MENIRIAREVNNNNNVAKAALRCLEDIWPMIENSNYPVFSVKVRKWGQDGLIYAVECEFSNMIFPKNVRFNRMIYYLFHQPKFTYSTGVDCVGGYIEIKSRRKMTLETISSHFNNVLFSTKVEKVLA